MKTNELRIGNYVQFDSELRGWIVDKVHAEYFKNATIKNVKGIPITRKWLLKFGFIERKAPENIYALKHVKKIGEYVKLESIGTLSGDFVVLCICGGYYFRNNLQYVHEIQNIYFALTGKELTIKEHTS